MGLGVKIKPASTGRQKLTPPERFGEKPVVTMSPSEIARWTPHKGGLRTNHAEELLADTRRGR